MSLLASAATTAQSAWWVAPSGSDASGDGTLAAPWATIGHAIARVPDGSTILVRPGTYPGRVRLDRRFATGVTVRSEVPYQARLRHDSTVVSCFYGQGIALAGFDIAHSGPGAGALVVQIQDLIGEPGGDERVSRIALRDNVIHDSFDNDLVKVNNGASDVTIERNLFYNQSGTDEHIDVNSVTDVVVQDNVFFNDFAGSGRSNGNDTSHYIVIKDSNGSDDTNLGSRRVTVRRNVFLHWEGSTGSYFVVVGEDGNPYFEAEDVLLENNLMIGDSPNVMRAAFGVKGARRVTFRHNTVVGDLPSLAFAMRLNVEGENPANQDIAFFNNVWSDPTGTMGAESPTRPNDFSDTPPGETTSFELFRNLYWNGGAALPSDGGERVNVGDDASPVLGDPGFVARPAPVPPRWRPDVGRFADGSRRIRAVHAKLAKRYGKPSLTGAALDAASAAETASEDILRRPRDAATADLGAFER